MTRKSIFSISIAILLSITLHSQSRGHLGKAWGLQYEYGFIPNLSTPNHNNNSFGFHDGIHSALSVVGSHRFGINYQIDRQFVINPVYGISRTGVDLDQYELQKFGNPQGYFEKAFVHTLEIRLKKFNTVLAPVGGYTEYFIGLNTLSYNNNSVRITEAGLVPNQHGYDYKEIDEQYSTDNYSGFFIGIGTGNQRVIAKRITFNYGASFQYGQGGIGLLSDKSSNTLAKSIQQASRERMVTQFLFQLKIGIGFLAF